MNGMAAIQWLALVAACALAASGCRKSPEEQAAKARDQEISQRKEAMKPGVLVRSALDGRTGIVARAQYGAQVWVRFQNTNAQSVGIAIGGGGGGAVFSGGAGGSASASWEPYVQVLMSVKEIDVVSTEPRNANE